ncbi:MAG: hypothetical protein KGK08_07145, partial [Acidobacteriota bacterium]|nr:hypothetical protein [Acidobacteriota bacterium]
GNAVGWRFAAPANEKSVAILVPEATPDHVRILAYNLTDKPVTASMTGWEVDPGTWTLTQGTSADAEHLPAPGDALQQSTTRSLLFERSRSTEVTFAPRTTTVLELKLSKPGVPYWSRPDLGIGPDDIRRSGDRLSVTVHSLGAVDAAASRVVLRDQAGKVLATARVPALKAPLDLYPKTATVSLRLPQHSELHGLSVSVEGAGSVPEITENNNRVTF